MEKDEKRLLVTGGATLSFYAVALGLKLAFPDMIVPFAWAMALVGLGIGGLVATLVFGYRALIPRPPEKQPILEKGSNSPLVENRQKFYPPETVQELKLTSMHHAATKIYSEFRRAFERNMPNRQWDNSRKALGLTAHLIANGGSIPIWGIYPPSQWLERLPDDDANSFAFSDDAKEMFDQFNPERRYTDIQIATADFDRRLMELRTQYGIVRGY